MQYRIRKKSYRGRYYHALECRYSELGSWRVIADEWFGEYVIRIPSLARAEDGGVALLEWLQTRARHPSKSDFIALLLPLL